MGNAASSNSGLAATDKALHVLRVAEGSPAAEAGIEPFFDFIVGIEGAETELSPESLASTVDSYESRPLTLLVHSSKRQETRYVTLTPSRQWSTPTLALSAPPPTHNGATAPPPILKKRSSKTGSNHSHHSHSRGHHHHEGEEGGGGGGSSSTSNHSHHSSTDGGQASLLGLSLRFCTPAMALENVWHVLDVMEGSPAESAGLVPYGDWVIGWAGGVLNHENDFYDVVEAHIDRPLRIYVYSHDFDTLREVVLVPNRKWGGEGLLGSGIGYGLLHRIPKPNLGGDDEM
ncbi:GRASP55/65 PDZ-like domain-containing protein [Mrakia frigida]|uniref:Grh1p n=1 Tax=Mrakia frigida TaxID=29902 RepID=UPI003FCC0A96